MNELFIFPESVKHSPEVEEWLSGEPDALYAIAREWFKEMRNCGGSVTELIHDGCPVACIDNAAFAYVNVFKSHVNVGFYLGAYLKDPENLLEGTGKRMRHIKIKPSADVNKKTIRKLIGESCKLVKSRI